MDKDYESICTRQYIVSSSSLIQHSSCFPVHFGISPSNSFSPRASAQASSFQSQIARRILPELQLAKNVKKSTAHSDYRFASLSTLGWWLLGVDLLPEGWRLWSHHKLPSGHLLHSCGKSPCLKGKSTISMASFNSYFDIISEGIHPIKTP